MDGHFAKLKVLKARSDAASTAFTELHEKISSDECWAWGKALLPQLSEAKAAFDRQRRTSAFWAEWCISASFSVEAKKKFSSQQMMEEFKHIGVIEKSLEQLDGKVQMIRDMRAGQVVAEKKLKNK